MGGEHNLFVQGPDFASRSENFERLDADKTLGNDSMTSGKALKNVYFELLRSNKNFRNLWAAQIVSQCGDWFNSIALYTLVLKLTDSPEALGLLMVCQFLPAAIGGLWLGPLVDRFPRKTMMLTADLLRAGLALCLLLVGGAEDVPLIYLIVILMMFCQSLFEPARKAILPDLVSSREMVAANAVAGATWASMLALGAALGGFVADQLGTHWVFCLNSASFVLSAEFVRRLPASVPEPEEAGQTRWGPALTYLRTHPRTALYAMSKSLWCVSGGLTLVLTLYGNQIFVLGEDGAISIGLFYACRGLGAGAGPFLAHRFGGTSVASLQRALVPGFLVGGLGYFLLSHSPSLAWALPLVVFAHLGGAVQWVFSTTLLQLTLPNRVRGRVFSLEFTCLTLTAATSTYLVGLAGEKGASGPELARLMSLTLTTCGLIYGLALAACPKADPEEEAENGTDRP